MTPLRREAEARIIVVVRQRATIHALRGLAVGAVVLVVVAGCPAAGATTPDPARLAALDPGARTGADTIVATVRGGSVLGVPDRPDYVLALGAGETIVGGRSGDDELGALAGHVTIRAGRGADFIYGGPDGTVVGGPGRDLLIETHADGRVLVRGDGDEVMVSGRDDRVVCSPDARDNLIYAARDDRVGPTCRADHDRVRPLAHAQDTVSTASAVAAAVDVRGNGSNDDPFVAPCDDPQNVTCTVSGFKERSMRGLWSNEYVPAYRCPPDHPYSRRIDLAPAGTELPLGVAIQESSDPWSIGVSISNSIKVLGPDGRSRQVGTATGKLNSSATVWNPFGSHWYRVVLHCTSDPALAAR